MSAAPAWSAAVLTVSDGVAAGSREDRSGPALAAALTDAGFGVLAHEVVSDDPEAVAEALRGLCARAALVCATGGTGLGPRDRTPEAARTVIDREVPGLAEAMRVVGREQTPMADLSRSLAGAAGASLVLCLPGSTTGATQSLAAVVEVLPHALTLLAGETEHHHGPAPGAGHAEPGRPSPPGRPTPPEAPS